jgi:hypothetical protein
VTPYVRAGRVSRLKVQLQRRASARHSILIPFHYIICGAHQGLQIGFCGTDIRTRHHGTGTFTLIIVYMNCCRDVSRRVWFLPDRATGLAFCCAGSSCMFSGLVFMDPGSTRPRGRPIEPLPDYREGLMRCSRICLLSVLRARKGMEEHGDPPVQRREGGAILSAD